MTDPADDIAALRARLARLEERVDMEAGLRAAVDRDLGDVRAALAGQRRVLQAIGTTQGQHTGTLAELGGQLDELTARVDTGFAGVDAQFAGINAQLAVIAAALGARGDGETPV